MSVICDLKLEPVTDSEWIRVRQVSYKQNGIDRKQGITCSHDSCAILVHNTSQDAFVFVRQFRPAVFMHEVGWKILPANTPDCITFPDEKLERGFTQELCAGIIDKVGKSIKEIAAEEVLEECGYQIKPDDLELVLATRNNSRHSGTLQHLFYVRVTDEMRKEGWGGGNTEEGEFIEILELTVDEVLSSIFDDRLPKPVGLTFALLWFLFAKTSSSTLKLLSNGQDGEDGSGASNNTSRDSEEPSTSGRNKRHSDTLVSSPTKKPRTVYNNTVEDPIASDKSRLNITDVKVTDVKQDSELQMYRLHYKQNDFQKSWDFFHIKSTCSTLVHNESRNSFFLVRKFSPAVYGSIFQQNSGDLDPSAACMTQLCSASYEEGEEPCRAASENVLRTFGYKAPSSEFRKIVQSRNNVGIAGALLTLLYIKVSDEMKVAEVEDDRDYDIVEIPILNKNGSEFDGLQMLILQGRNPLSLSLALLWYYYQNNITN